MPVSVVVGGQYGSEGKGKVALELRRRSPAATIVIRPGGTNSGHTGYRHNGTRFVLRQLPAAAIDGGVKVVLPAGSYIDVQLLREEISELGYSHGDVIIDPRAQLIRPEHAEWERQSGLAASIGSTTSGTGAAVMARLARFAPAVPIGVPAGEVEELQPYIADTVPILRAALNRGERIIIEGTQGFGLSPVHGDAWPKATSRDTTAASFVAEAGLSPLDVDQIVLVLRAFPIRVAGDSGPLSGETSWSAIAAAAGASTDFSEFTSVTKRLRRVGTFDSTIVKRAIDANRPTDIVLNHVDHIDASVHGRRDLSSAAIDFISLVERDIEARINWIGTDETSIFARHEIGGLSARFASSSKPEAR
ncbi:MAG TPA: adenylosuccinate synthetase [Allosphingosinicella sp.]|jgi:adenylosuccinate synthase|nr:adenylosuccinate synthetase [Allosphingosinicella sp.]